MNDKIKELYNDKLRNKYINKIYDIEFIKKIGELNNNVLPENVVDIIDNKKIYVFKKEKIFNKSLLNKNIKLDLETKKKKIFGLFNKLSNKNYDKILNDIYIYINRNLNNNELEKILIYIIELIIELSMTQKSYCELYAKIFIFLINKYNNFEKILKNTIIKELNNKYNFFINLEYNDITELNYDKFCEYVKNKKKMIGLFEFLSELYILNIVNNNLIINFIKLLIKDMYLNKYIKLTDILCESLFTLLKRLSNKTNKYNKLFYNDLIKLSKINNLSNRTKFKILDILDIINKK